MVQAKRFPARETRRPDATGFRIKNKQPGRPAETDQEKVSTPKILASTIVKKLLILAF